MKIEASKNQPVDKKDSKNVIKTETSAFHSSNPPKISDAAPAPTPGAFARILAETRKPNEKDNSAPAKTDSSEPDAKTSKSETEEKISRATDEQKELDERNSRDGETDAQQHGDESQAPVIAHAGLLSPPHAAATAPAARSILHVADLERIVSSIRTETFQNQKQVVIALKNSVLLGLQIKLTITENGKLKAEFLALNEQIKKQLNERKTELAEILKNRSALFSEVEIHSPAAGEKE